MAKTNQYGIIGVVVVIAVVAAILFAVPVTVTYQTQETYIEKEPVQVPLSYQVVGAPRYYGGLEGLFNYVTYAEIEVKNTDTEPGTFVVNCQFKTLKRGTFQDSIRIYVVPGESKVAKCKADTKFGEDVDVSYNIEPSTKTIYRDVEKTRTVTKTREVRLYQKLFGLY